MQIKTKQMAMDLFEKTRKEFLDYLRWLAKRRANETMDGVITIDDVRRDVETPQGVNPKVYGAVFNSPDWEKVGYTQTTRETSHGRVIARFRYKFFRPNTRGIDNNFALF